MTLPLSLTAAHPLAVAAPPPCATAWGEDGFGPWFEFAIADATARMRWVPPGRFLMGSPASEAGRFDNEGPRHDVVLTQGFWLADTPCTQALWNAVMPSNPSRFVSPTRPVENVDFDDCRRFLEQANAMVLDLDLRLPTEAEWERACRAGTDTSTFAGELVIVGENNAPLLDAIAWYGGNSGVDFELDNGWDSSTWPEQQHRRKRAGSHPVGKKAANSLGLFDMLGNVWEWCADWYGSYAEGQQTDPRGSDVGSGRVIRGGAWLSPARPLRAAWRVGDPPGPRIDVLGFRLARGQERSAR